MICILPTLPAACQAIAQPPAALYYEGDRTLLEAPKVAIVGTRRPSGYTKALTGRLARELSEAGVIILSGGAMGVDAIAHEHSFPRTIAVLAGSLDVGFVQTNRKLIERIRTEGLLLSEYEASTPPKPWSFVHRNRLVTALADAVVVMEADEKSGSMSSARFALQQGRPLYVPPHRLGESAGTNTLLQSSQALPLWGAQTVLDALAIRPAGGGPIRDELLHFCADRPTYEAALERFGARLMEYELSGRIVVVEGRVEVCRGDTRA